MQVVICAKTDFCLSWGQFFYILIMMIPALFICWVDSYTNVSYFSISGIIAAIIAMIGIVYYCFEKLATHTSVQGELKVFDFEGFLGNIGVAMFVFEGNAVILNIRAETKEQEQFPKILVLALDSAIVLFSNFSLICYVTFLD